MAIKDLIPHTSVVLCVMALLGALQAFALPKWVVDVVSYTWLFHGALPHLMVGVLTLPIFVLVGTVGTVLYVLLRHIFNAVAIRWGMVLMFLITVILNLSNISAGILGLTGNDKVSSVLFPSGEFTAVTKGLFGDLADVATIFQIMMAIVVLLVSTISIIASSTALWRVSIKGEEVSSPYEDEDGGSE
jgi:hypothetical protein